MDNLIWCSKFKININPDMKENCLGCIFWQERENKFGYKYKKCTYDEWTPGLKKGKING